MCTFCRVPLKQEISDYVSNSKNQITMVQGVPCRICQQCGERYFDTPTVSALLDRSDGGVSQVVDGVTVTIRNFDEIAV